MEINTTTVQIWRNELIIEIIYTKAPCVISMCMYSTNYLRLLLCRAAKVEEERVSNMMEQLRLRESNLESEKKRIEQESEEKLKT